MSVFRSFHQSMMNTFISGGGGKQVGLRNLEASRNQIVRCIHRTTCRGHFQNESTGAGSKTKMTQEEAEARRKAMMAKGLPKRKPVDGVKNVVLVASGKGGVGKSTVSVNLAVGLKLQFPQKEIGLLDADVFGPSLPIMMNLKGQPEVDAKNLMIPLQNYGVKCMSMGFLVKEGSPVIWRGLMVMQAIENLVRGVNWAPLDVLVVDMPPGTGDTQLTFAQSVVIDGAVMVTTPQQVALQDALKGAEMFKKTNVPLLGFVLNMSSYLCPSCGSRTEMSSSSKAKSILSGYENGGNLLGNIPFEPDISETSDEGTPIVVIKPESVQAKEFRSVAKGIMQQLDERGQRSQNQSG